MRGNERKRGLGSNAVDRGAMPRAWRVCAIRLENPSRAGIEVSRQARHDRAMLAPILIVLHQETSTPGRLGHALRQRGYPLDVRRPRFGDPLPETMAGHAGAITFGGPMSANDTTDFIRREI